MAQSASVIDLQNFGPGTARQRPLSREAAVAYCRRLALAHYENFTVASWLLPRHLLPHFYAIYAYCRWADDLADETADSARALELLDWWQHELAQCYAGAPGHPVFVALAQTIEQFSIPVEPFESLLAAFRQDQRVSRHATHDDVLRYCQNSANPVGRLILYLGHCHEPRRGALSDDVCTGLQLANFCQDVARDWQRGRIYLPQATLDQYAGSHEAFVTHRVNDDFRQALALEVERADNYLRRGEALVPLLPKDLRLDVALFAAGGRRILQAIRRIDYDVWRKRPRVSRWGQMLLFWQSWRATRSMPPAQVAP